MFVRDKKVDLNQIPRMPLQLLPYLGYTYSMVKDDFLGKRRSSLKVKEYLLRWWNTLQQFYVFTMTRVTYKA